MAAFIELNPATHGHLGIAADAAIRFAEPLHLLNLQVTDVAKTVGDVPVFFSRNTQTGQWLISALCSFTPGQNLLVQQGQWQGSYQPACMQTFPLYLPSAQSNQLMLLQDNTVVKPASDSGVTALFTADGSPSLFLRKQTALLEADLRNEYLSFQFIKAVSGMGLLKELDLQLLYPDGSSQIIKGLATVDEDKLQLLSADALHQLQQQGYLLVLHAMLLSISQLNKLIQYHNKLPANQTLKGIKLEINRSQH
jgi:hypothetical protein